MIDCDKCKGSGQLSGDVYNDDGTAVPVTMVCDRCEGEAKLKSVKCPDCDGEGITEALMNFGGFCAPMKKKCTRCDGRGQIPEEMLDWKKIGAAMKQDRLDRGLSQREEADRIGIHVAELSQMEAGIVEPIDYYEERDELTRMIDEMRKDEKENDNVQER